MISDLLEDQPCRWCGTDLSRSFLTRVTMGIEKDDALLYPVLCLCGGITVIGAETFISRFGESSETRERGR